MKHDFVKLVETSIKVNVNKREYSQNLKMPYITSETQELKYILK